MKVAEQSLNDNSTVLKVDSDYVYVTDMSDIHVGNRFCNEKALKNFIDNIKDVPNMYVIIGGDSTDSSAVNTASSLYEESLHGIDQVLKARDLFLPIKDKILFIRSGNHGYERALKQGKLPPEQILAELLEKPFFHGCASVFLHARKNCYVISTWHNSKKSQHMEWMHSDVTFYEHLHKNDIEEKYTVSANKFANRFTINKHYDIQTGSFLGWGGYGADKGYRINACKTPIVEFSGIKNKRDIMVYRDIDMFNRFVKNA